MHKINESNLCTKCAFKKKGLQFMFKNINRTRVLYVLWQAVPKIGWNSSTSDSFTWLTVSEIFLKLDKVLVSCKPFYFQYFQPPSPKFAVI